MINFMNIQEHFEEYKSKLLEKIAGDASDRSYYRFPISNLNSIICMEFKDWNSGFGGSADHWIEMQKTLQYNGIPVPDILFIDKTNNCIWISDLGNCSLIHGYENTKINISDIKFKKQIEYYEKAIHTIIKIQYPKVPYTELSHTQIEFDFEKLQYEFNFFITHFFNGLLIEIKTPFIIREKIDHIKTMEMEPLCKWLAKRPKILCHRDFHSKNLMIKNQELYVIDFQDARMGPHTYDIASLLRDSYSHLTKETESYLFKLYYNTLSSHIIFDYSDIADEYQKIGFQRNIKALGSFAYLSIIKGKHEYLKYISSTLKILTDNATDSINFCPVFTETLYHIKQLWESHDQNLR